MWTARDPISAYKFNKKFQTSRTSSIQNPTIPFLETFKSPESLHTHPWTAAVRGGCAIPDPHLPPPPTTTAACWTRSSATVAPKAPRNRQRPTALRGGRTLPKTLSPAFPPTTTTSDRSSAADRRSAASPATTAPKGRPCAWRPPMTEGFGIILRAGWRGGLSLCCLLAVGSNSTTYHHHPLFHLTPVKVFFFFSHAVYYCFQ